MVNHLTLGYGTNSQSLCLQKASPVTENMLEAICCYIYFFFFLTLLLPLVFPLQQNTKNSDCWIFVSPKFP